MSQRSGTYAKICSSNNLIELSIAFKLTFVIRINPNHRNFLVESKSPEQVAVWMFLLASHFEAFTAWLSEDFSRNVDDGKNYNLQHVDEAKGFVSKAKRSATLGFSKGFRLFSFLLEKTTCVNYSFRLPLFERFNQVEDVEITDYADDREALSEKFLVFG